MASVWTKPSRQTDEHAKMWPRERKAMLKNKGGQEEEKAERTWMVERDGAPDLTTLTHSGLSLLASCALWSIPRGHTRTHIYLSTHAGDEDILGLYACVCLNVTAYPCMLKRVWTLPKILPSVFVFLPAFVPLCSCPWTCMHICVCIRIFTRLRSVLVFISICFSCSAAWAGRILVCSVSPCTTPSSLPLHRVSTCVSRLRTISNVEPKRSN